MKHILFCLVCSIILLSCSNKKSEATTQAPIEDNRHNTPKVEDKPQEEQGEGIEPPPPSNLKRVPPKHQQPGTPSRPEQENKIIKTAEISLQVQEYHQFNNSIHQRVGRYNAYIASEQQKHQYGIIENSITIKVPIGRFDELIQSFTEKDGKILEKTISSEDVTAEVVDVASRLESKKQARAKYLALLQQAKNVDEMLNVQSEIDDLQEEIEATAARLNYLNQQAAYSTINLRYFQEEANYSYQPAFLSRLGNSLEAGAESIVQFFLFLAASWPWIIIIAVIIFFLIKKNRFRKVKSTSK